MTTSNKTTSTLKVDGMKCQNCANRVEKTVSSLPGVYDVAVDLDAKTVALTYDSAQINRSSLAAAIDNLGYKVAD